jgi:two-component system, cell cycle response regulator DivK
VTGDAHMPTGRSGAGETVLLVDDNDDARTIYGRALEHFGFLILEAESGDEGIRIAIEDRPAIIIMDLSIPGVDGLTATRMLKDREESRGIPIIVLTAHALPEYQERAEAAGCDAYLTKPCEPRRLVEEIRRLLGA